MIPLGHSFDNNLLIGTLSKVLAMSKCMHWFCFLEEQRSLNRAAVVVVWTCSCKCLIGDKILGLSKLCYVLTVQRPLRYYLAMNTSVIVNTGFVTCFKHWCTYVYTIP